PPDRRPDPPSLVRRDPALHCLPDAAASLLVTAGPHRSPADDLARTVGRLLTIGTNAAVLLLAIGCVLLFAYRLDPLAGGPPLDARPIHHDNTPPPPARCILPGG